MNCFDKSFQRLFFLIGLCLTILCRSSMARADQSEFSAEHGEKNSRAMLDEALYKKLLDTVHQARQLGPAGTFARPKSQSTTSDPHEPERIKGEKDSAIQHTGKTSLQDEHRPPRIMNLIVNGQNLTHLRSCLSQLKIAKRSGIEIGEILIIGFSDLQEAIRINSLLSTPEEQNISRVNDRDLTTFFRQLLKHHPGHEPSIAYVETVLNKYQISKSPTWILRDGGYVHVYEGYRRIADVLESSVIPANDDSFRF